MGIRDINKPQYPNSIISDPFQVGLEYQDFVMELLFKKYHWILQNYTSKKYQYVRGENLQGIEIKLDNRWTETGRMSIEIAEKSKAANPYYVPSGIYAGNSLLYIQGNYIYLAIFSTNFLIKLHRTGIYEEHELPTIKKFYLSKKDVEKYAIATIKPEKKDQLNLFKKEF